MTAVTEKVGGTTYTEEMKSAVFLKVAIGKPGTSKKLKKSQVEVDANEDWIGASKKLLVCPEMNAITTLVNKLTKYLQNKCLPTPFLASGIFRVPPKIIEDVDTKLQETQKKLNELVNEFCKMYETRIAEAKEALRSNFNAADYPPVDVVKGKFYIRTQYMTWGTPAGLEGIKKEIFDREREKGAAMWKEATEEVKMFLRQTFAELVGHMVDTLSPDADGKKKKFHESSIQKIKEFMVDFDARNITGDEELEKLVEKTRELMKGASVRDLRKEEDIRNKTIENMTVIKTKLTALVEKKPARKIVFVNKEKE